METNERLKFSKALGWVCIAAMLAIIIPIIYKPWIRFILWGGGVGLISAWWQYFHMFWPERRFPSIPVFVTGAAISGFFAFSGALEYASGLAWSAAVIALIMEVFHIFVNKIPEPEIEGQE